MSFAPIGPYRLSRADHVAASLVISFLIGRLRVRVWSVALTLVAAFCGAVGLIVHDATMWAGAALFLVFVFVLAPVLRFRRDSSPIMLSESEDGLTAETGETRTTYKWATIRSVRRIGPRLFVMVTDACALVIDERNTTPDNLAALTATLRDRASTDAG